HQDLTRVESDELDLSCLVDVLQREQHADRRRLVRREHALQVAAEAVEQILRGALRCLTRRTGVLVRGYDRDTGKRRLDALEESALALFRALRSFLESQDERVTLAAHGLAESVGRKHAAPVVVGGDVADNGIRLEAGVDDDGRYSGFSRLFHGTHER